MAIGSDEDGLLEDVLFRQSAASNVGIELAERKPDMAQYSRWSLWYRSRKYQYLRRLAERWNEGAEQWGRWLREVGHQIDQVSGLETCGNRLFSNRRRRIVE